MPKRSLIIDYLLLISNPAVARIAIGAASQIIHVRRILPLAGEEEPYHQ